MKDDPKLSAAFAATCDAFGEDKSQRKFMPHLSLIYSDISQEQRKAIVDEARLLFSCRRMRWRAVAPVCSRASLPVPPAGDAAGKRRTWCGPGRSGEHFRGHVAVLVEDGGRGQEPAELGAARRHDDRAGGGGDVIAGPALQPSLLGGRADASRDIISSSFV